MNCPDCHALNSEDRRFCAACGAALAVACAECGFANGAEARFCGGCGRPLAADAPSPGAASPRAASAQAPGERRQVTVLFADLSGFTALSHGLDAEDLHALMGRIFAAVDAAVESYGGTVDKHIGDSVMAVFGAPVAHGDDPVRALRAAVDIHGAVAALGETGGRRLAVHVGVASGEVVAAGLGGESRRDYTVLGDSVNLASRLEALAEPGETLISEAVFRAAGAWAECEPRGEVTVKGLEAPVRVWRLLRVADAAPAARLTPFVGRQGELTHLASLLDACRASGGGQAVYLRGEPGIGKTRLVEELTAQAEARGFACHKGLVLNFGVGHGQGAVPALARSLLGVAPDAGIEARRDAAAGAVARGLVAEDHQVFLNDLLDLPQPEEARADYDAMDSRTRTEGKEAALVSLVRALSAGQPMLLVVEDVHWSDETTQSYLARLVAAVRDCPAVLAMTTRVEGDPLDGAWRDRIRGATLTIIELAPLRREEAESLANALTETAGSLVARCIARSGGNPLFLEQLVHNAAESGQDDVPATIQSLVLSRMDRLPAPDKAALQAASAIGQRFTLALLRHLLEDPAYAPERLLAHDLVRPEGEDLLFAHALIQESVYGSLLKARRRALHKRAAAWFAERDPALYAEHLDRADDPEAPAAYLAAARQRAGLLRFERAERLAARGLELARDRGERYALSSFHGEVLHDLGETERSIEAYRQALDLARDPVERCRAQIGVASGMRLLDRFEEAFAALDEAEGHARERELGAELAQLHHLRGNLYFPEGDFANCQAQHELALKRAREVGSARLEARALGGLGDAEYARGRMLTANGYFRDCVELARRHGFRRIEVEHLSMVGFTRYHRMEIREALEDGRAALEDAQAIGHLRAQLIGLAMLYWTLYDLGELDAAADAADRSEDLAARLGAGRFAAQTLIYRSKILRRQGKLEAARKTAERALEYSLEKGSEVFNAPRALAALALHTDDPRERQALLDRGTAYLAAGALAHNHFLFHRDAIDACLQGGDWDGAEGYAERLSAFTRQEPLPLCDFLIARGRALAAHGRGACGEAHHGALDRLCRQAKAASFATALPELEAALAEAGG